MALALIPQRLRLLCRTGALCLAWQAGPAWALGAAAPFSPPAPVAAGAASAVPGGAAATAPSGLNGIRLGAQPQALIDGQWLATGALTHGARVATIGADAVQLRHPDGRLQRLPLIPQVELQRAPGAPGAAQTGATRAAPSPEPKAP